MQGVTGRPAEIADHGPDRSARLGGGLLLLTAAAMAVGVFTRVAADADQDTLWNRCGRWMRTVLFTASLGLPVSSLALPSLPPPGFCCKPGSSATAGPPPLVPYLFALSGVCTVLSGACAILIAAYTVPEISYANGVASAAVPQVVEVFSGLRWITGKIGFSAAGVALLVAARFQWQVGGTLKRIAPLSAIIGLAMQFIWVDAATIMHPIVGTAFFLWLLAVGTMLATSRVEKHFVARYSTEAT